MKGALTLLLSLAIVTAAAAIPAVECASAATVGSQHGCCGEQAITFVRCCFRSQPTGDRALTSLRTVIAQERHAESRVAGPASPAVNQTCAQRWSDATSPPAPSLVPIYIQQLSLLI